MAGASFEQEFLDTHNAYRRKHGTAELTLSRDLCNSAQEWADHLVAINTMQHSNTNNGENLYYTWSSAPNTLTGHFTQVVWKESTEVGVGLGINGETVFVVGQYNPAGNMNMEGYFIDNVLPEV
ncbi:Golgi-associated plant pathogenesis-related protein 1 isoform X3 [Oncorhynchus mykiss]|uniref:Golgi-associated plant pathogenesis-related protein 1 isoform X3 n=1 Tax=Oncorhynchus mykiss TaxID=8022 RepID=UPI000B4F2424|nr:Golgi-associated plant pathogenesis-related protein 1 isoform X3 [Oncorhynchus mykiss]